MVFSVSMQAQDFVLGMEFKAHRVEKRGEIPGEIWEEIWEWKGMQKGQCVHVNVSI